MGKALVIKGVSFQATALAQVVFGDEIPCTDLSLSPSSLSFEYIDDEATITANPTPSNTTDQITWESSNESVATVLDGVVTLKGLGTATITANCGTISENITITVSSAKIKNMKKLTGIQCTKHSDATPCVVLYNNASYQIIGQTYAEIDTDNHVKGGNDSNRLIQAIKVPYGATRLNLEMSDSSNPAIRISSGDPSDLVLVDGEYYPKYLGITTSTSVSNQPDMTPGQIILIRFQNEENYNKVQGVYFTAT